MYLPFSVSMGKGRKNDIIKKQAWEMMKQLYLIRAHSIIK